MTKYVVSTIDKFDNHTILFFPHCGIMGKIFFKIP